MLRKSIFIVFFRQIGFILVGLMTTCTVGYSCVAKKPQKEESNSWALLQDFDFKKTSVGTEYRFHKDIGYLGAEKEMLLDVYQPGVPGNTRIPAVLIIHGGGWATGSKSDQREREFAEFAVDEGYLAVSINYTLTQFEGDNWTCPMTAPSWPANIYDCKSALRWMKKYAEDLGIDPDRIAVMGGSAGGHLALLTGLSSQNKILNKGGEYVEQDNSVRSIVDFYGIPDVRTWGGESFIRDGKSARPDIFALASPVEHLWPNAPPMLIVHGTEDPTVSFQQSEDFVVALQEKSLTYTFVPVEGAVHSFGLQPSQMDLRPIVSKFLKKCFYEF